MSRDLTTEMVTAIQEGVLRPVAFFEADFPSGTVRIWSGLGDTEWDGKTWLGLGDLLSFDTLDEVAGLEASGFTVSLSGVPVENISLAIDEIEQGRPGRVWLGLHDEDLNLIADPTNVFTGKIDVGEIADGQDTCTVSLTYESAAISLDRSPGWLYTSAHQNLLYPGQNDRGFDFVPVIQEQNLIWGG